MRVLLIGGTGTISMAITKLLLSGDNEVYLLNRGSRNSGLEGNIRFITADINNEEEMMEADIITLLDDDENEYEVLAFMCPDLNRIFRFRNEEIKDVQFA